MIGNINPYNCIYPVYSPVMPACSTSGFPAAQYQGYYPVPSQYMRSYANPQIIYTNPLKASAAQPAIEIPWITDPTIKEALSKLGEVSFQPGDVEHMRKLGVNIIFNSGNDAIKTIADRKLKVEFGQVADPKIHAQYDNEKNLIIINNKYKGTKDLAVVLAISEAMFHEIGHARDADGQTSIQEEIDCLALNTLANRYHQSKYPAVFNSTNNADIVNDGVSLYTKLFFDPDPRKTALVNRILEKYGDLPMESKNHKIAATLPALISTKILYQP